MVLRRQGDHAMISPGRIRFRSSLMAMRRIPWIAQPITARSCLALFGGGGLGRWRIAAITEKASITRQCQPLPGHDPVVIEPELAFAVSPLPLWHQGIRHFEAATWPPFAGRAAA